MIISTAVEKAFDKIQHPFLDKNSDKTRKRMYFNLIKTVYDKPKANIILNEEKLKLFHLKSETNNSVHTLSLHSYSTYSWNS
jgi:threonyl-tRNA synthetase